MNVRFFHLLWAGLVFVGCIDDPEPPLGLSCDRQSDCADAHSCEYERCRESCESDRDCDQEACVGIPGDPNTRVCTVPLESDCDRDVECPDLLICGHDGLCRNSCDDDQNCGESRACYDNECIDGPAPDGDADSDADGDGDGDGDGDADSDADGDGDGDGDGDSDADGDSCEPTGDEEVCCDGIDNDCDPETDDLCDEDEDGAACDVDCDDADPLQQPGVGLEVCNLEDDDCDGVVDEDCFDCDLRVPADHAAIQDAIDAAPALGTVCVHPGTYLESLDFGGHEVRVVGLLGPYRTIIDAGGVGPAVSIATSEGEDTALEGFTVTGGASSEAAGVLIQGSSPRLAHLVVGAGDGRGLLIDEGASVTLEDSIVTEGVTSGEGGGILVTGDSTLVVENTRICGNVGSSGGGVALSEGELTMTNVILVANEASAGDGGGLLVANGATASVVNVVIYGNHAVGDGGGIHVLTSDFTLRNTAISENTADEEGDGIWSGEGGVTVDHCGFWDNGDSHFGGSLSITFGELGNEQLDPRLIDVSSADCTVWNVHLQATSLYKDEGHSAGSYNDFDESPNDIGAYGGPGGGDWDIDMDGSDEWWQPGDYNPLTYPAEGWDCADYDPTLNPDTGC